MIRIPDPYPNNWPWREGHVKPPTPDAQLRALLERLSAEGKLPIRITITGPV